MSQESQNEPGTSDLIESVQGSRGDLKPAERRVADFVLVNSRKVISMNLGAFAREAGVSPPTAIRFCRSVGCDGFSDLKLQLAQSVASAPVSARVQEPPGRGDDVSAVADKVFGGAMEVLRRQHAMLDRDLMGEAADSLAGAGRIEIAAAGGAVAGASGAAYLLRRMGLGGAFAPDIQSQRIASASLGRSDMLLVLDFGDDGGHAGRCADLAEANGATILGFGPGAASAQACCDLWVPLQSGPGDGLYDHPLMAIEVEVALASIAALAAVRSGARGADRIRKLRLAADPKPRSEEEDRL